MNHRAAFNAWVKKRFVYVNVAQDIIHNIEWKRKSFLFIIQQSNAYAAMVQAFDVFI